MGQFQLYQSKTGLGPLLYPENHCHHPLLGLLPLFYLIYIQTGSVRFWHICGIQPHDLDIVSMRVVASCAGFLLRHHFWRNSPLWSVASLTSFANVSGNNIDAQGVTSCPASYEHLLLFDGFTLSGHGPPPCRGLGRDPSVVSSTD